MLKKMIILLFFVLIGCEDKVKINISEDVNQIEEGIAILQPLNNSGVKGSVIFKEGDGFLEIFANVDGLSVGDHGLHIYEHGDMGLANEGFLGSVFHLNSSDSPKMNDNKGRILGDLGSIYAINDSTAEFSQKMFLMSLGGENSVLGRLIVVHGEDVAITQESLQNTSTALAAGIIGIRGSR